MTHELKPCPFCGGKPQMRFNNTAVECSDCGAVPIADNDCLSENIKAWNTRPQSVSNSEALEKAEKLGEKIKNALNFIRYGDKSKTIDGQALAEAMNALSAMRTYIRDAQQAGLTPPVVDVETLKRVHKEWLPSSKKEWDIYAYGWNKCIDHLASQGYITTPAHIEVMKQMREILAGVARDINLDCGTAYAIKSQCKQAIAAADALIGDGMSKDTLTITRAELEGMKRKLVCWDEWVVGHNAAIDTLLEKMK